MLTHVLCVMSGLVVDACGMECTNLRENFSALINFREFYLRNFVLTKFPKYKIFAKFTIKINEWSVILDW